MLKRIARYILRDDLNILKHSHSIALEGALRLESLYAKSTEINNSLSCLVMEKDTDILIKDDKIRQLQDLLKKRPSQTDIARANLRMFGQMTKLQDLANKSPSVLAGDILIILEGE